MKVVANLVKPLRSPHQLPRSSLSFHKSAQSSMVQEIHLKQFNHVRTEEPSHLI
jgi:hypothetical protein